jgi:predicted nucleic acid-binding protein
VIVVADTTPLRYLGFIGEEHVLATIFSVVYVPPVVLNSEL